MKIKHSLGLLAVSFFLALNNHAFAEDSLKVHRNLKYAEPADEFKTDTSSARTLDIYLPAHAPGSKLPVIVFIHGGGFVGGDKQQNKHVCTGLAGLGYAIVSINYRLYLKVHRSGTATKGLARGPQEKFPPALKEAVKVADEDARLALAWVKQHADQYELDLSRLVMAGGSAGAITALYTAYASRQNIVPIKAVINFWGGLEDTVVIEKNAPPLLTFHGDQDDKVNVAFAYALQEAMKQNGNDLSETHIMAGKGHAQYVFVLKEKKNIIASFLNKIPEMATR